MQVLADAAQQEKRVATLSLSADLRFENPRQREAFSAALLKAVTQVISEHSSPEEREQTPATGRPFRLMIGCHPVPQENNEQTQETQPDDPPQDERKL